MIKCLNKTELEQLFRHVIDNETDPELDEIISIYEGTKSWEDKIVVINFIMTQLIQRDIKKGSLKKEFLSVIYNLPTEGDILIDEIEADFIEYMFNHVRHSREMNENLIRLKEKYLNYDYSEQVRY